MGTAGIMAVLGQANAALVHDNAHGSRQQVSLLLRGQNTIADIVKASETLMGGLQADIRSQATTCIPCRMEQVALLAMLTHWYGSSASPWRRAVTKSGRDDTCGPGLDIVTALAPIGWLAASLPKLCLPHRPKR